MAMIVTIDGPAGAGKSSVAKALAARLGFRFLDTGAMYRAVALAALEQNLDWDDPAEVARVAREARLEVVDGCMILDGRDVSDEIRTLAVTNVTHYAANNTEVRAHLVELQRRVAGSDDLVTEGRDQGTVVFPNAECKIFLTASPEERARRRRLDLLAHGDAPAFEEILRKQNERDRRDASRAVGPLVAAQDAVEVSTDHLTSEQVVSRLEELVRERIARLGQSK